MANLSTTYMGLPLKNPLIIGSSGLTDSVSEIAELEARGAAGVVVKSLFEEEIVAETQDNINRMNASGFIYPETMEYFDYDQMADPLGNYLKLLKDAKSSVNIPIFASINCISAGGWIDFAKRIEDTGVDALELNVFSLPSDFKRSSQENEQVYFDIIDKVTAATQLPISLKIGYYNASLANFIQRLSETPIKGIVLFNRFYNPDFDVNTLQFASTSVFSTPAEISTSLRWIAIMSGRVQCDLAASTGIHDGYAIVKQLLAGANAVQVCSAVYRNGKEHVTFMIKQLEQWMDTNGYSSLDEFRGKMSQVKTYNPAAFERVQFMKYFHDR
ncbi:diguanylate cyclase [Tenuifilaceae bacterium CYCD]|nr:diguanylate cyclase [Tenuifilaceae bacterium CYCD]